MDFRSANSGAQPSHQPANASGVKASKNENLLNKLLSGGVVVLLFSIAIIAVAVIGIIALTKDSSEASAQNKFVKSSNYQAVFLTNGQVYFGNIEKVGSDYISLKNIFYLTQNTSTDSKGNTTTNGNYTLVKLGCQQIHDPLDQMVIERSQVSFWENLDNSANSKVVTSIKQFNTQNPKGPDCTQQQSSQTQASSSTTPQGAGTTTGTGTTTTGR